MVFDFAKFDQLDGTATKKKTEKPTRLFFIDQPKHNRKKNSSSAFFSSLRNTKSSHSNLSRYVSWCREQLFNLMVWTKISAIFFSSVAMFCSHQSTYIWTLQNLSQCSSKITRFLHVSTLVIKEAKMQNLESQRNMLASIINWLSFENRENLHVHSTYIAKRNQNR